MENETSNWIIHWYEVGIWNFSFFSTFEQYKNLYMSIISHVFINHVRPLFIEFGKYYLIFFQIITNTPNDTAIYIWLVSIFEFISLQNDLLQTSIESVISLHIYQCYLKNVFKYIWVACFVLMCLSTRFFNNVEVDNH